MKLLTVSIYCRQSIGKKEKKIIRVSFSLELLRMKEKSESW